MRRTIVVLIASLLAASNAGATDVASKWGIGASVFNGGVETSVIRGVSDRTAWVLGLFLSGSNRDRTIEVICPTCGPLPSTQNTSNVLQTSVSPALRRFTRPASEFSPYGDLFVSFGYGRDHSGAFTSVTSERVRVGTGLAFGLEYFTRRHFSFAAHTDVVTVGWDRLTRHGTTSIGAVTRSTVNQFNAQASLAPRLVVRAYF